MAVPKKRTSKTRKRMRRSHHALEATAAIDLCEACGAPKLRHHVCLECGTYRGTQVIEGRQD